MSFSLFPTVLLPTPEACWDYGLEREATVDIPLLGSLSPFKFLKGAQFDTKLFKLSEAKALIGQLTGSLFGDEAKSITEEVVLVAQWDEDTTRRPSFGTTLNSAENGILTPSLISYSGGPLAELVQQVSNFLGNPVIKIAPNWQDNLSFNQSHTWGKPDDIFSTLGQQGISLLQRATRVINTGTRAAGGGATEAFTDFIDRYQGSNKPKISIPFTLFTRNNFERDILFPLIMLNYMSYPYSNSRGNGIKDAANQSAEGLVNVMRTITGEKSPIQFLFDQETKNQLTNVDTVAQAFEDVANRVGARFFLGAPPRKFTVNHTAGLFKLKAGVVESFTYNFKGPWVKKEYTGLAGIINSPITDQIDRQIGDAYSKNFSFPPDNHTYPIQCECTLEIRDTEPWFAHDWIDLMTQRLSFQRALEITVSQGVGGTIGQQIAAGAASSLPGVLPDIRRQPNANNWVPPGETFSGIPGLF